MKDALPWAEDGAGLHKTFVFDDFKAAIGFTVEVARLAEDADHHPDIDLRWNKVTLTLVTHSAGNKITEKDRSLADRIDKIPAETVALRTQGVFTLDWTA
ncbi:4a-hydroxytetrahydrobiopterin dehydratase [Verrucomicrobium sp. GAS474]|uniref:4a-hydroxytetrahydrobiopterin dehydratase n=1 Tax=Verrucomicrobium sp. GAS474 TaxID=1882831 RepID=UPI00087B2740|nr:4a-hydroxytetrahydrobiopterin dehydratase [Verrucomicrobium sp. GAS474]SDU25225.1 4a-hydroxytetrahydrobiopterin dehydratase [Verrucomicrobium sp. GAS474]